MEQGMETADLIIGGGYVITVDKERRMLRNGAIAIRDGKILAVDHTDAIERRFSAKRKSMRGTRSCFPDSSTGTCI